MHNVRTGIGGMRVGFRPDPTPYHAFKSLLEEFGFGKHCPNPRTDANALHATVSQKLGGRNRLIASKGKPSKKKRAGVEVVDVTRQDVGFNDYNPQARFKLVGADGDTRVQRDDWDDDEELTEEFLRTKAVLTSTAINGALNDILAEETKAVLGLTGKYIPEVNVPAWRALAERLFGQYDHDGNLVAEGICGGEYEVSTADLDADTIRCIRARLATETKKEAERICWDSLKGTLNAEQVQTRCDDAQALLEKIKLYEAEFRLGLDDLKAAAESANRVAVAALFKELTGSEVEI